MTVIMHAHNCLQADKNVVCGLVCYQRTGNSTAVLPFFDRHTGSTTLTNNYLGPENKPDTLTGSCLCSSVRDVSVCIRASLREHLSFTDRVDRQVEDEKTKGNRPHHRSILHSYERQIEINN